MTTKKQWKKRAKRAEFLLQQIRKNSHCNLIFCDQATQWLGDRSERWCQKLGALNTKTGTMDLYEAMSQIRDAYHTIGVNYPWEES